ncbi:MULTISPECIES: thymidine phosphorylase [unclassified Roseateles]|uniref:thymidine phosphorylase n=1 Tax=unclassified Roseateles TaxID=2626991 RepID=UPI0006F774B7|nr:MULTISPECIES: thymidine phosphorylase [unclassified Roseateles]KQW41259.1 thymidine phosphorylase [Pelomonas sp. Root405]KRA68030.1 thymidine phosphorylase [Pelomonas sp. Root662]
MLAQEIIRAKRDGQALNEAQINHFVRGLVDNSWSEGQVAALGMAVFLKGMGRDEAVLLTRAMMNSGRVMRWPDMPGPVLDKHSSGGVGDKVSLMLAPMVAACGGYVPMIAGRGLGHTGGTVDKLEAIAGYTTTPDPVRFDQIVRTLGCAIIGQTADLAPADKRFYATRDVTATVESVPLITASILSKKLAAGLEGLAMDIKCGNGAFASTPEFARELAESIVAVAGGAGLKTRALITDMNQILGTDVGNSLEVIETIRYLKGEHREPRLHEVTLALCAEMLVLGGLAASTAAARVKLQAALDSGAAAEKFAKMVVALGGPADLMERPEAYLTAAPVVKPVPAPRAGVITTMSTRDLGVAIVELGGGRRKAGNAIDMRVGFSEVKPLGTRVAAAEPLALIHAADEAAADRAVASYLAACTLGDVDIAAAPMVMAEVG